MSQDRDARKIVASRDYKGWLTGNHNHQTDAELESGHRVLNRIRAANGIGPACLVGMEFVRYVRDTLTCPHVGDTESDFAWAVYVSHDPCHDNGERYVDDRNTVIALHRWNGTFKILGREMTRALSLQIAKGEV